MFFRSSSKAPARAPLSSSRSRSPLPKDDVIRELFGNIQFSKITNAFEAEVKDLIWAIKEPLGDTVYTAIRTSSKPAESLIDTIYDRRGDKVLIDAFRDYVLRSDGLYSILTPEAKRKADKFKANPLPDTTSSSPGLLSEATELTSIRALKDAQAAAVSQGKVAVVLFSKAPISALSRRFSAQLADLARSDQRIELFTVDIASVPSLGSGYDITATPTTLIFSHDGFYRAVGTERSKVEGFITQTKGEIDSNKSQNSTSSQSTSVQGTGSQVTVYNTPEPPEGWNLLSALAFWKGLPDQMIAIKILAVLDPRLRAKLYHTMPYIEKLAPSNHKSLDSDGIMDYFCAHHFKAGQVMVSCFDCGLNGNLADYCVPCYDKSDHKGHVVTRRTANEAGQVCHCGRMLRRGTDTERLKTCSKHAKPDLDDLLGALVGLHLMSELASSRR